MFRLNLNNLSSSTNKRNLLFHFSSYKVLRNRWNAYDKCDVDRFSTSVTARYKVCQMNTNILSGFWRIEWNLRRTSIKEKTWLPKNPVFSHDGQEGLPFEAMLESAVCCRQIEICSCHEVQMFVVGGQRFGTTFSSKVASAMFRVHPTYQWLFAWHFLFLGDSVATCFPAWKIKEEVCCGLDFS